jgi:hypothetical protein
MLEVLGIKLIRALLGHERAQGDFGGGLKIGR